MATAGVDCHITLQHATVNSGTAVGFILKADKRGPVIVRRRPRRGLPLWADGGGASSYLELTVQAFTRMLNPNGSEHGQTPSQIKTFLESFWGVGGVMTLTDPGVSYTVAWADDGLIERRYSDGSEFDLKLVATT